MAYTLKFSATWERNYKKLEKSVKERAAEALARIMANPYTGKPLVGNLKGFWSFRIGMYRIIYEINEQGKEVLIGAIGPRKSIYG